MNCFRRLCAVSMMTLMIMISAFAGQMSCPIASPPPPPADSVEAGDMETTVAEVVLSLAQSMLLLT